MKTKTRRVTSRQSALLKNLTRGMSITEAARKARYKDNGYVGQLGSQALRHMHLKMPEVLEKHGLTDDTLIENYLIPLMNAHETKYFPYVKRVVTTKGTGKNKVETEENKQIVTTRTAIAWIARRDGLDLAFRLKGSYAPKTLEEAQVNVNTGVKVIVVDVPRPPKPSQPVIPSVGPNGDKPQD